MNRVLFNLQLFAGSGAAGAGGAAGSDAGGTGGAANNSGVAAPKSGKGNDLSGVVYGKADPGQAGDAGQQSMENPTESPETKAKSFENLIKGEYKEEFTKRTQDIIDKRFRETKEMESRIEKAQPLLRMLEEKYGTTEGDLDALMKAIDEDDSFYQDEAIEKGLTVKQLKDLKRLERENERFRRAEEEARRRTHGQQIYARWVEEANALKNKYGLADFSLENEVNTNSEFAGLLQNGISVESAYMATHMDQMLVGAMAQTAGKVKEQMVNNIASRNTRPSENGVSSHTTAIFKNDVNQLTKADRREIERRVQRGERITF